MNKFNMEPVVFFISGHLDLTTEEFEKHYIPAIDKALEQGGYFVIGDARGTDTLAQSYLLGKTSNVTIYHMFESPRNNMGFATKGGFTGDSERDQKMTKDSHHDIAWVRPGRETSGTQRNINRRKKLEGK